MARRDTRPHRILITGASDGLGYRLACDYAARGHTVLATGSRRIVSDREHFGDPRITYVRADQSEPATAAATIAEAVERLDWDGIDVLVLNAAMGWAGDPAAEPADGIATQIAVNLTAPVAIAHRLSDHLFKTQGRLVLIGSTAERGAAQFATYAATKSALDAFSRSLREEWRGRATVQMIHPGPIRTQMHERAGLNVGAARMFFMPVKRASKALQRSIRKRDRRRVLSRSFGWGSIFARQRENEL